MTSTRPDAEHSWFKRILLPGLALKAFVIGGFHLPESKGGATWVDENTLLVSRDFGEGTLTTSGYPFVVKRLARGQRFEDASEVFRGKPEDVSVSAFAIPVMLSRMSAVPVTTGVSS